MLYTTDVVVIGAGPVGLFSVFELGMLKMKCHIVDTLDFIGGQCSALYPEKPIYDIPAHPSISAQELIDKLEAQIKPFDPTYHLGQQVISVKKNEDKTFDIVTSKNTKINTKSIIIAAGCGAFGPNRPPLENIESFEEKSIIYSIRDKSKLDEKDIIIAGGGDSAVDWAIALSENAKSVTVVHRRPKFRCAPESASKLQQLADEGKITIATPYQLERLHGQNGILDTVDVVDFEGNRKNIKCDVLLPFFGLSMDLGPILEWKLSIEKKHISVASNSMETSVDRIYAIGDVATYPGKLKLILTGFSEAALASHSIYSLVYPDTPLHFEYSTTKGVKADETV
ncbi:MAG: NAD(P)/FAD-dependent oxidoreductase [Alphaproteobacteria bacterium]|nr:NAD(P)/FAD-dependent oxidoreductase [Alphaproteobacteria bacterium]